MAVSSSTHIYIYIYVWVSVCLCVCANFCRSSAWSIKAVRVYIYTYIHDQETSIYSACVLEGSRGFRNAVRGGNSEQSFARFRRWFESIICMCVYMYVPPGPNVCFCVITLFRSFVGDNCNLSVRIILLLVRELLMFLCHYIVSSIMRILETRL